MVWCVLLLEGLVVYPERRDLDNAESSIECGVASKPNRAPEVCGWPVQGGEAGGGNSSLAVSLLAVLGKKTSVSDDDDRMVPATSYTRRAQQRLHYGG